MIIKRTIQQDGFTLQMDIELTALELRTAHEEYQECCRMEDIRYHLADMEQGNLSGFTVEAITSNLELMRLIFQRFCKYQDCNLPENDVMEESIRGALADYAKKEGEVHNGF